jgi:hypothetical protein
MFFNFFDYHPYPLKKAKKILPNIFINPQLMSITKDKVLKILYICSMIQEKNPEVVNNIFYDLTLIRSYFNDITIDEIINKIISKYYELASL